MDLQVVATLPSLRYYDQNALDNAVRQAWNLLDDGNGPEWGVRRWTDTDEWEGWTKPGDPILSAELSKWADLVVVAPCSADMLAKVASGFSDNLAVSGSTGRALPLSWNPPSFKLWCAVLTSSYPSFAPFPPQLP